MLENKFRAVLFDLDDTLYSRKDGAERTFPEMFRRYLYPSASESEIAERVAFMMTKVQRDSMICEEAFDALLEKFPSEIPYDRQKCVDHYYRYLPEMAVPFPETHEVLKELKEKGLLLCMVTNVAEDRCESQWRKIRGMDLEKYFDAILLSGELGIHKPDKRIFLYAAEKLGVLPEECLFVGDAPNTDVSGALEAGMEALWIDIYPDEGLFANEKRVRRVSRLSDYFK